MKIFPDVAQAIDLEAVVSDELAVVNRLLPPRWGDVALVGSEAEVARWLRAVLQRDNQIDEESVLLARKFGRGARPLSLLGLKERLLYRGVVSIVTAEVGVPDRSLEAFNNFQMAPLSFEDCAYVVKTDIAAYYQYVDHERLVDEVVAQTGYDLAISMAVELLRLATGRSFGLPQLSLVSDVLAEIYIDPMQRELTRSGFRVARFADDFRVACKNYDEALGALEMTDHAARELGLVLNEWKTATVGRDRYETSVTATQDREVQLFADLEIEELEEPELGDYDEVAISDDENGSLLDEPEFEEQDVGLQPEAPDAEDGGVSATQLAAAQKVLELWIQEEEDDETQRQEPARITAALLGRALRVFALAGDTEALNSAAAMLVYEPSLTPTIARYIRASGQIDRKRTRDTLDEICKSGIVSAWQAVWIAYVAGELPRAKGGGSLRHVVWLRDQTNGSHPAVAAEAILALARRGQTNVAEVGEVLNRLPAAHRPTALLALAALGEETAAMAAANSRLDKLRVKWALEEL